tara:strand:- start:213 stop:422 length:210 start_codon:yes stop_codon:yes gene_type:complete
LKNIYKERRTSLIDRKVLEKILTENSWGLYLKGRPLEEINTNVGVIYKICEVSTEKLVDEYNVYVEKEE